jgi:hypothetical protein
MSDLPKGELRSVSGNGVAGVHPRPSPLVVAAAPATGSERNTIRAALFPVACWRIEDVNFDFGSSFVQPVVSGEMGVLKALRDEHPSSRLAVFGHADPVGDDERNKQLSGRRARAIYAMLTRRTDLWEELYQAEWGDRGVQIMLDALGFAPGRSDGQFDAAARDAVRRFQLSEGLPADGQAGPQTRKALFQRYMDQVCSDDEGTPFSVPREDFLGAGEDERGKADYQGCSEFNAVLRFSQAEEQAFARAGDKSDRDTANRTNRRVVVLLFRPGARVDPARWPCPRAAEPSAGCRRRFFSDHEKRRAPGTETRRFDTSFDTFACRFYQRLTLHSPCERTLRSFDIRLYDPEGVAIADAPFVVKVGGRKPVKGVAKDAFVHLQDVEVPSSCVVEWGFPPASGEEAVLDFRLEVLLGVEEDDGDREGEATRRLHNLGYADGLPFASRVAAFQRDFGAGTAPPLRTDGVLDDPTLAHLRDVYERSADDLGQRRG